MKYLLFFISFWSFSVYSQDVITTKKGEDISAKVLEVNINEVKYKRSDNPQSPIYSLLKSDILIIRYENGTKDIFSEEEKITKKEENTTNNVDFVPKDKITIVDNYYAINGKRLDNRTMKSLLSQDPEVNALFKKSQRYGKGTIICSTVSVGLCVTSLIMFLNKNNFSDNRKNEQNVDFLYPLLGGVGMLIPSTILTKKTLKYRAQAVDKYNNLSDKKVTITPIIGGSGAGIAIQF